MNTTENHSVTDLVAENISAMRISAIKEMAMLSAKIEGAASLTWGLPSFRTPAYIRNHVHEQLEQDKDIGKYALPDGLPQLRQLVVRKHQQETGIEVNADENIMITAGNMQAMNTVFHVITEPGDEIILTDPCFASHIQQVLMVGGKPVYWPLDEDRQWSLDLDALSALITERTRAIVIVTPSNPTGKIFSKNELIEVGQIAKTNKLLILVDDPYHYFSYENRSKYFNLSSVSDLFDHMVYCFTFSKSFAMSGWRLGYMIMPGGLKKELLKVHDATMICVPRISQVAGIGALSSEAVHIPEFEKILGQRRELICQRLDAMSHVFDYVKPEGAYYVFPKILTEHSDSRDFCLKLLNEAKVTLTPGSAFGPSGEHHVRMAYCVPEETINVAFDRMEEYFSD